MEINEAFAPQVIACLARDWTVHRIRRRSIRTAARSRSGIRSAHPVRGSRLRRCTICATRRRLRRCSACIGGGQGIAARLQCRVANRRAPWDRRSGTSCDRSSSRSRCGRSSSRRGRFAPANAHPAPHAVYDRLDGGAFRVADERGRLVFLDFYASWCEPCKLELPLVERWSHAHPEAVVVPVDVGEPRSVAARLCAALSLERRRARSACDARDALFGVAGFPTIVVVDRAGLYSREMGGPQSGDRAGDDNAATFGC